jgi:hypothetical protein
VEVGAESLVTCLEEDKPELPDVGHCQPFLSFMQDTKPWGKASSWPTWTGT